MNHKQRTAKRPIVRGGVVGLVGLLLVACISIGCTTGPATSPIFEGLTGLDPLQQARLAKDTSVSQTRDGVTVTVVQVYADANQVVIGYEITSAEGRRFGFEDVQLKDRDGNKLLPMTGMGTSGPSNNPGLALAAGEGVQVMAFDASRIQGAPLKLDLHLTLTLHSLPPALGSGEVGPFAFDLSAPFNPGRTIQVQQTVQKAWINITLERVVITPSGTRAHICYDLPTHDSKSWTLIANLDAGDGREQPAVWVSHATRIGEGCDRAYFQEARLDQAGTWTLTVTELVGNDLAELGKQMRWSGPWIFQFQVP